MRKTTPQKRVPLGYSRRLANLLVFGVFLCTAVTSLLVSTLLPGTAAAATNANLNFQARLQTSSGTIVPDGYYNVEFKLYTALAIDGGETLIPGSCTTNPGAAADEDCVWTERYYDSNGVTAGNDNRVRVKNGYLTVNLGSQTAFGSTINWDQVLWIGINIGGTTQTASPTFDGEMTPRLQLTAVPYAFRAAQLAKFGGTYTSTLSITDPTVGNQSFVLPDMAAAGTFTLLNNVNGVQNQDAVQQSARFNLIGTATGVSVAKLQSLGSATASTMVLQQATSQTGWLLELQNTSGVRMGGIDAGGGFVTTGALKTNDRSCASCNSNDLVLRSGNSTSSGNTGNLTLDVGLATSGTNGTIQIGGVVDTAITLGHATGSGTLTLGQSTASNTINIGNANTTTGNTQTVNIAAGTPAGTGKAVVNVGNSNDASTVNVNAGTGGVNLLSNNSPVLSTWTTAANNMNITGVSTTNRARGGAVASNGFLYHLGGVDDAAGTMLATVQYAPLLANGNIGSWASTTALNDGSSAPRKQFQPVAYNGYIYVIGGRDGSTSKSTVLYAKQNSDGTLGSWQVSASALPSSRFGAASVAYNGYMYVIGGFDGAATEQSTTYYAKINADGSTGSWTSINTLPSTRANINAVVANGYIYVAGGYSGGTQNDIYKTKINASGTVDTWGAGNGGSGNELGSGVENVNLFVGNGYLYAVGGDNDNRVGAFQLNADGTVNAGTTLTTLPVNAGETGFAAANGYFYLLGGSSSTDGTGTLRNTIYYASVPRVKVGGALDLVGYGGENLNEGGSGGSLTAGDTAIIGTLQVQNSANFSRGASISGALSVNGDATFRSITNTTAAFQVLGASSNTPVFNVDTLNGRVGIGTAAPAGNLHLYGTGSGGSDVVLYFGDRGTASNPYIRESGTSDTDILEVGGRQGLSLRTGTSGSYGIERIGIDTSGYVGINATPNASYQVNVGGDLNISGAYKIGGTNICTSSGCTPTTGSGSYIQNGTGVQNANFNVRSNAAGNVAATISGHASQSANIFVVQNAGGANNGLVVENTGWVDAMLGFYATTQNTGAATATIEGVASSTTANLLLKGGATPGSGADLLQMQNSSSQVLAGFKNNGQLYLGRASGATGSMQFFNSSNANTVTIQSGVTAGTYTLTLPTGDGNSGDCLKDTNGTGALGFSACGGSSTLQDAYDAGANTAVINLNANDDGILLRDTAGGIGGNLFAVQNSGGTASYFGVTATGVNFQNGSAANIFALENSTGHLKIYNPSDVTKYADIYFDNSTNQAVFAAAGTGATTRIGAGTGNINMTLSGVSDVFAATKGGTLAGAYSLSDFTFTRNVTAGTNSMTGTVLKVENTSSGTGIRAPTLLLINDNDSGSTGNLIVAQRNGADRFSVTAAGTTTVSGALSQSGGAVTLSGNATSSIGTTAGDLSLQATANLNIGNSGGTAINIGTNNAAHTIGIGNTGATGAQAITVGGTGNTANTVLIQGGTGTSAVSLQTAAGGTVAIGTVNNANVSIGTAAVGGLISVGGTAMTGTITIGQSTATNTINIGNANTANAATQTINIGAGTPGGTGRALITIGNTGGATSVDLRSGSGGIGIGFDGASSGTVTIGNGSGNLVAINGMGGGWQVTALGAATFGAINGTTMILSSNFTQNNASTFQTGTGAVSLRGDTTISAGKILTLGSNATDPTGTNGAMYYNSTSNRFRCRENGAWKECNHRTVVRLAADAGNNNATANTMEDVTGLSWSVASGTVYNFQCQVYYTAAATTTGSRWAINGPAATSVYYKVSSPLTATTDSAISNNNAYDGGTVTATSLATTANMATIQGYVLPSAAGTVIVRHSSEVSGSLINAKAGSTCEWW